MLFNILTEIYQLIFIYFVMGDFGVEWHVSKAVDPQPDVKHGGYMSKAYRW